MNRIGFIGGSDMRRIMEGDWISLWQEKTGRKEPDDLSDVLPVQLGTFTEQFNINWFQRQTGKDVYDQQRVLKLDVDGVPCRAQVDGVVFVADSMRTQKEKNIESLNNLFHNLKEWGLDIKDVPIVLQYNKRDLDESNIPILSTEEMQEDLNAKVNAPYFLASALKGPGVFPTLREISKLVVKDVSIKVLKKDAQGLR